MFRYTETANEVEERLRIPPRDNGPLHETHKGRSAEEDHRLQRRRCLL